MSNCISKLISVILHVRCVRSTINSVLILTYVVIVTGCGESNNNRQSANQDGAIFIPKAIQSTQLPMTCRSTIQAWITIDERPRELMSLTDNIATYTISNVTNFGNRKFFIEFICENNGEDIQLANAKKFQAIQPGPNQINFENSDYILPDTDNDNVSNLRELELSTDPLVGALPSQPSLVVNGSKQLMQFSWSIDEWAARYQLLVNPDGSSGFIPFVGNIQQAVYNLKFAAYKINQTEARYVLEACNNLGCSAASNTVGIELLNLSRLSYVKAPNTGPGDRFGRSVALSADGNTLAIGANFEDGATKITGDNSDIANEATNAGAVYVYTRLNGTWSQPVYIKASNAEQGDEFGHSLALSADGNTLAVGAFNEDGATIISGSSGDTANEATNAGAVYVYKRLNGTWSQPTYIKASNTDEGDGFGYSVALSADGNTLAVGAIFEDGAAIISGSSSDTANEATNAGAVYMYERLNGTWSQPTYIKAPNAEEKDNFGVSVSLSADGNTLAVGAEFEDGATEFNGSNIDIVNGVPNSGAVYVYTQLNGSWSQPSYIKASNNGGGDRFGYSVALSADGNTLAVGAITEDGVMVSDADPSITYILMDTGAAYVYTRINETWSQAAYITASNTGETDWFGNSLALSADGNTLAVGAILEDGIGTEIIFGSGDKANGALDAGAAYIYTRLNDTWLQLAYIKAPNTGEHDGFGFSLALSADGNTLALGAPFESGDVIGVSFDSGDTANGASGAGAVYVY